MNLHFLVTGDINTPSGEFIYYKKIIEGMRSRKYKVFLHTLPSDFPFPNVNSLAQYEIILDAIPANDIILIPGAAFAADSTLIEKYTTSHTIISLIHAPVSMSRDLTIYQKEIILEAEKKGLAAVKYCIVSNESAKNALLERGVDQSDIYIAAPGIDKFPLKNNYSELPYKLLCVSNYTRKNGLLNFIKALSALKGMKWELTCYGIKDYEPAYMDEVNLLIRRNELNNRINLNGPFSQEDISGVYLNADLVILPSDYESFGMTISEALMHGVPVVASSAGLINTNIPPKAFKFFKPGNIYDIQSILELLFESPPIYKELCKNAAEYRQHARSWNMATDDFENAIKKIDLLFGNKR